jgi:hypothetical protein
LCSGDRRDPNVIAGLKHPVLAMDCSPGKYPAPNDLDQLSSYFKWSKPVLRDSFAFIGSSLRRPFVAVHFRTAFAQASCGFSVRCGAVASFLAAGLTEIYLRNVCSCQEILRRNGAARAQCGEWESPERPLSDEVCTPGIASMEAHLRAAVRERERERESVITAHHPTHAHADAHAHIRHRHQHRHAVCRTHHPEGSERADQS